MPPVPPHHVTIITGCAVAPATLPATGFVNGKWRFQPTLHIYRIDTPQPKTKNLLQLITSATPKAVPNLMHIRPRGMGFWAKYNHFHLFIYTVLGAHLWFTPVNGFSRMMAQTTRTHASICPVWVSLTWLPTYGVKSLKNSNFGE